jgi:hypothetical protein
MTMMDLAKDHRDLRTLVKAGTHRTDNLDTAQEHLQSEFDAINKRFAD